MKKILFLIIVGVGTVLAATSVPAATFTYNLGVEYSGGTEPAGDPPWLTAVIEDVAANTVRITMSTSGLTASEFVSGWYFNWDFEFADLDPVDGITLLPISTEPFAPITFGTNNLDADGILGHGFDILFNFPTASPDDRFEANEIAAYEFMGNSSSTLSASSFNYLNAEGNFYSAAHVQAINGTGAEYPNDDSGWIGATESISPIPEPATILLLGTGLASLFGIRRYRFTKK